MRFRLPPLTVQPLVENAVRHGVTKKKGGGTVTISVWETADSFLVKVEDTGCGFDRDLQCPRTSGTHRRRNADH